MQLAKALIAFCLFGSVAGLIASRKADQNPGRPPTAEAQAFVESAEKRLFDLWIRSDRASWVQNNFITDDTERIAAQAQKDVVAATTELAVSATRFDTLDLPYDVARKLKLLKLSLTLPAPRNAAEQTELTEISAPLKSDNGKGRYCPEGPEKKCLDINDMTRIMATSRNPDELLRVWRGWRTISPPMRKRYERLVELANKGARELGFA